MKSLIVATILLLSVGQPLFSQVDFEGGTDIDDRRIRDFQDQRQSLIDSFMDSRNNGGTIIGGDDTRDELRGGFQGGTHTEYPTGSSRDFEGGTHTDDNAKIDVQDSQLQINSRQLNPNGTGPNYKIDAPDPNTTQERTAPMHLYFDQIHFESDDVSEVTLKDGTVVKTEELQDFAKEVIMKKLNEQK